MITSATKPVLSTTNAPLGEESRITSDQGQAIIREALAESAKVKIGLIETSLDLILAMAQTMIHAIQMGGKIVFLGNGGSAADAQHLAAELVGRLLFDRRPIPAIALTTNTSILTAVGNDYGFDVVFRRQVEALICERDVVVAISTSGNSTNVIAAVEVARAKGAQCIGFTGKNGGDLAPLCDLCLMIPAATSPRIQEAHITVGHILCELIEMSLCSDAAGSAQG